jgi:hypothetical protein
LNNQKNKQGFFRGIIRVITPTELVTFTFIFLMLILTIMFNERLDGGGIFGNVLVLLAMIILINYIRSKSNRVGVRLLQTFYIIPVVIYLFKTVEKLSFALHGRDYDNVLITIDRAIFGGANPSVWLFQHIPVMPIFVEIMQLCYFSYYFLPVVLAIEFFRRRRRDNIDGNKVDELETLRFVIIYGLLLSYLGYFALPGIGPRFTLFDFWSISKDLPGVLLTEPIRWFINLAENIRTGMTSIQAAQVVTRDVFPSGHTEITLLSIMLGFKYKAKARWAVLFIGSGLIFSTVYLRYHYFIDLVAGALVALLALYTAEPVIKFLQRMKSKL